MKKISFAFDKILKNLRKKYFSSSVTVEYPFVKRQISQQSRSSFAMELNLCTGCMDCENVCPTQAIGLSFYANSDETFSEKQSLDIQQLVVDYSKCVYCGLCVDICEPKALTYKRETAPVSINRNSLKVKLIKLKSLPDKIKRKNSL